MKFIRLSGGKQTLVDDDDFEALSKWRWRCHRGYAIRDDGPRAKRTVVRMHRAIMNAPSGLEVDHISGDTLDNRKSNLRICTHAENLKNVKKHKDGASAFKGVSWDRQKKRFRAQIFLNGKNRLVGRFRSEAEAHGAYVEAAKLAFGEFARA